jgi:hypothetical protein
MAVKASEYHEGPEALDRFKNTMTALFRVPKTTPVKEPPRPVRKPKKTSKG